MEVSGQLHVPAALPPLKDAPVPIEQEARLAGLDAVKKRKIPCFYRKSNPAFQPVACL
jgi:hypothetical protein